MILDRLYGEVRAPSGVSTGRVQRILDGADVTAEHRTALGYWLGGGGLLSVIAVQLLAPIVAIATALATALLPVFILMRWSGRREHRLVEDLPVFIDTVGRQMRSGSSFRRAVGHAQRVVAGPAGEALAPVARAAEAGQPISRALTELVEDVPRTEVRLVAAALALGVEHEAGTGVALAGVAQSLRDRAALRDEVVGLAAQASASMHALVLMPLGFLALDAIVGGGALGFLVGEPFGRVCLIGGGTLDLVGWAWMRLTIQRRLPT